MSSTETHTLEIIGFVVAVLVIMGGIALAGVLLSRRSARRRQPTVTGVLGTDEPEGRTATAVDVPEPAPAAGLDSVPTGPGLDLDRAAGEQEPDHATSESVASAETLLEEIGLGEEIPLLEGRHGHPVPGDAAGWHPDPDGRPNTVRYWDGQGWTDHFAQKSP